jgi:hypothetical protein
MANSVFREWERWLFGRHRLARALAVLASAMSVACEGGGTDGDHANQGGRVIGASCERDSDCGGGLRCLTPLWTANKDGYCSPPCETVDDCGSLSDTTYFLQVPLEAYDGNNDWNTDLLMRGVVCAPAGDEAGAPSHCQFLCPDHSAVGFDEAGDPVSCGCLPHFSATVHSESDFRCEYDETVECAILQKEGDPPNVCNECNSEEIFPNCPTGRFACLMNNSFEGFCVHWADNLDGCASPGTYDCNPDCQMSCGTSPGCLDICCTKISSDPPDTTQCGIGSSSEDDGSTSSSTGSSGSSSTGSSGSSSTGSSGGELCPYFCDATISASETCWDSPVACESVVDCNGTFTACESADSHPDCDASTCTKASECDDVLEDSACGRCASAKCCGALAHCAADSDCYESTVGPNWDRLENCVAVYCPEECL